MKEYIKKRLLADGYVEENGIEQTVENLMNLKGDSAQMLKTWLDTGRVPDFEPVEGIDKSFLRTKLKMKDTAIILAYAMLQADAKAVGWFKHLAKLK